MAGFDYEAGRSNNMLAAEAAGKITIGRWAKRYGVSARAAVEVMRPHEAHHTGTGRRGKSRLTPVIDATEKPTAEELAQMQAWDRGERAPVQGWYVKWERESGPWGRRINVPTLGLYRGDPATAPKDLDELGDAEFAEAQQLAGKPLVAYATSFREIRP